MESGTDTIRSRRSHRSSRDHIHDDDEDDVHHGQQPQLSPKPMTPRRVKRRSVMTRGTSNHNVTGESSSNRSSRRHSNGRNSTRSSRRKLQHQNPVTKLMDQQASSSHHRGDGAVHSRYPHMTPSLTASNLKSLNQSADPIYNMNSSSPLLTTSHSTMTIQQQQHIGYANTGPYQSVPAPVGHYNPTYQHSTPNLMSTNSQELIDELYHRPPSVRSSYSNFHGARSVYALNNLTAGGAAGVEPPIPQVPQRRPAITGGSSGAGASGAGAGMVSGRVPTDLINNDRSMAFMSSAPPAYNYLNYHTPPDSETTM